jgi:hypothetical protein
MKPVTFVPEAIVHSGEGTVRYVVKAAAVEAAGVKPTRVKPTRVKPATMEPATTVESSTTMESSTTVAATSAPMRCVSEVWLAEYRSAQQRGCDAYQSPPHSWPGSFFA